MSMIEAETMSAEEQIDAMEKLWSALSRNKANVKSPEWHDVVLAERKEKIESGNAVFYTLDEVKAYFHR